MPNRFVPASQNASLPELIRLSNTNFSQLDSEAVTKTYKQPGGNAVVEGKLPYDGGYGQIIYDSNNLARVLIGIYEGRPGIWISADGIDVLEELGL